MKTAVNSCLCAMFVPDHRCASFPSSSLGTQCCEAPLRTELAASLVGNGLMFERKGSRASQTCVPKLELGNEKNEKKLTVVRTWAVVASAILVSLPLVVGCSKSTAEQPLAQRTILPIPSDAPSDVGRLLEGFRSPDAHERSETAFRLGELGQQASSGVPHLIDALKDENWRVRSRAAEALGKIGDAKAVAPLISLWETQDSDWEVRARCVESLGKLKDDRGTATLIVALEDMVSHVRYQAAVALNGTQDSAAIEALEKVVQYDPDPTVRDAARESLKKKTVQGNASSSE